MALLHRVRELFASAAAICFVALALAAPSRAAFEGAQRYDTPAQSDNKPAQSKDKPAQVSEAETKAIAKITAAPDPAAKIQAAGEFVKKYPKSSVRAQVAAQLAREIGQVQDAPKRVSSFESLLTVFKEPSDAEVINPFLIDAYIASDRLDDAFRLGAATIAKNPDDLATLTNLAIIGVDQVKKNNPKYVQQSQTYGGKAIELIEAGKKPDSFDDARWADYKTTMLPQLYQRMGVLAMVSGNKTDARTKLEKAVSLNSADPFNHFLLGAMLNEEYTQKAQEYQKQSPGPLKDVKLKEAEGLMDKVIDVWARVVAMSEGKPQYQQLHDTVLQDLQSYYKYRHGGSVDGLQQMVDKYKKGGGQ
jgi:tetratricopeptide (TPR) repeat protein